MKIHSIINLSLTDAAQKHLENNTDRIDNLADRRPDEVPRLLLLAQNGIDGPEADCPLLTATCGEADARYQIWGSSLATTAAVHRTIAERRELTH